MESLLPLLQQMDRRIVRLGPAFVQMSLMSVSVPGLAQYDLATATVAAATSCDIVGELPDGSIGVFSLLSGQNIDSTRDEYFQMRFQAALPYVRADGGEAPNRILFRSVTAFSADVADAQDLVNLLFATPAEMVRLTPQAPVAASLWPKFHAHWLRFAERGGDAAE